MIRSRLATIKTNEFKVSVENKNIRVYGGIITMFDKAIFVESTSKVRSKHALTAGSSQHGKHRLASVDAN